MPSSPARPQRPPSSFSSWFSRARTALLGGCLLALAAAPALSRPLARLPALGADAQAVTVSGLSSGAYMAAQFQVTFSASLAGAGIVEGGPYGCSRGSVVTASEACSCPSGDGILGPAARAACMPLAPSVLLVFSRSATEGMRDQIDDIAHLKQHRVWIFSGGQDHTVPLPMVDGLQRYYEHYGVSSQQLKRVHLENAGHGFPLKSRGRCELTQQPYLNGCEFDGAGELLKWVYDAPALQPAAAQAGSLKSFSQRPYREPGVFDGLDDTGWVYIPEACEKEGANCRLHVAFHGCSQGQSYPVDGRPYGKAFVEGAGYNDWAEGGNIVVLYPQVRPSNQGNLFSPYRYNPKGCWDFWGYTDPEGDASLSPNQPVFAKKTAPQMRAVKRMIDALLTQGAHASTASRD